MTAILARFQGHSDCSGSGTAPPSYTLYSTRSRGAPKHPFGVPAGLLARISQRGRCIGSLDLRKSCCMNGLSRRQGGPMQTECSADLFGFATPPRRAACAMSPFLAVEDMVKSRWVYRKLRNFRAGIEAGISCLKRAYGF